MKIREAEDILSTAIRLLDDIKRHPQNRDTSSKSLEDILEGFTPKVICTLKEKIRARRKKRLRQARRRKELKDFNANLKANREKRAAEADIWLRQCMEMAERTKAEESVRRQADVVLHSVTRKKVEARRILALLPAISRLRAGRCQRDAAQGGQPSKQTAETFEVALKKLQGMWERQLEMYNKEEIILKVMLDEGSASRLGRLERDVDSNLHDWLVAMFGGGSLPETTWPELVEIRRSWDQYVVPPDTPLSSAIPSGWVLPPPLSRQDWIDSVCPNE